MSQVIEQPRSWSQPRNVGNVAQERGDLYKMTIYRDGKVWLETTGKVWMVWEKTFSLSWTNSGNIGCETIFWRNSLRPVSRSRLSSLEYLIEPLGVNEPEKS